MQAKLKEVDLPHGGGELMLVQNLAPKIFLATLNSTHDHANMENQDEIIYGKENTNYGVRKKMWMILLHYGSY